MARARRIERAPGCPYPQGDKVEFQFEGRTFQGHAGEPLAVALLAGGVKVFGRSIKYHRPRGPFCLDGHCTGCLVRVDGEPNVRACRTLCRAGAVVERQLGWPHSGRDLFRLVDWVFPDHLDHHGLLTSSGLLNRLGMRFVRRLGGFGHPPTGAPRPLSPKRREALEVLVIGAGLAGLHAALEVAEAGLPVRVLEAEEVPGGRLRDAACRLTRDGLAEPGWTARAELLARLARHEGARLETGCMALAMFSEPDGLRVLATSPSETLALEPRRVVVATGAYAPLALFENNDLPGVLTPRALDRLVCGHGVLPAEPVVVAGEAPETLALADELCARGVRLAGLITDRPEAELPARLRAPGLVRVPGQRILRARGARWLERIELAPPGRVEPALVLECGLLAAEAPAAPAYELAHHAGCRVLFHSRGGHQVHTDAHGQTSHGQIFAAGHCAGAQGADEARLQGQRAGLACALSLREDPARAERLAALSG
jgi:sarcosine oxidase subunit alpha